MKGAKARIFSVVTETGQARWGEMMRKFTQTQNEKEMCKSLQMPTLQVTEDRSERDFPTGSKYEGSWDLLGISGYGVYTYANGVVYEGEFQDGVFHGEGELIYETGEFIHGKFEKGTLVERQLVFCDGLEYKEEDWEYCKNPDRRFTAEYEIGLQPATKSFKTFEKPCKWIPKGYYDTGNGYFHPTTKTIYRYEDLSSIVSAPSEAECKWIEDNCRNKPKLITGPRPDLYESWTLPALQLEVPPPPAAVSRNINTEYFDEDYDDYDVEGYEWRPSRRSTFWDRHRSRFSYTSLGSKHSVASVQDRSAAAAASNKHENAALESKNEKVALPDTIHGSVTVSD